jgi:hypothetical protein
MAKRTFINEENNKIQKNRFARSEATEVEFSAQLLHLNR